MALKTFRRGESSYVCRVCKKRTRNVGGDEESCQLCLDCFNLASIDNHRSDNGKESMLANYGEEVVAIFNRRPELGDEFPELREAVYIPD